MTRRTRRRLSDGVLSRRSVIAGIGSGLASSVGLAGCLSSSSDDSPQIGVDEGDLEEVAEIDVPEVEKELPVGIADDHVNAWEERIESLLEAVPADLVEEIPNEAVRDHIDEARERAHERRSEASSVRSNYARLRPLRAARRYAAEAEGRYAAAMGEREREEVYDAIESDERLASELGSELTRTGERPHHAVVVYDAIEGRLRGLGSGHSPVDRQSPLTSEVEAVGEASGWLETHRARIETVEHVLDRQIEVGETTFDGRFERTAAALLEEVETRTNELPSRSTDAEELFDAPVEGTPREHVAQELHRMIHGNRAREEFEDGWLALSLVAVYGLEHELRTLEVIRERIEDGDLDVPDDVDEIREAKRTAIDEAKAVREESERPYLVQDRLRTVFGAVSMGDWEIDQGRYDPDRAAIRALGGYELSADFARTLPETTEWFVEALERD